MDMVELWGRGTGHLANNDSPALLVQTAELILDAMSAFPSYGVVAASTVAERVLGAMMVVSPTIQVGSGEDIVIFDVNLASGTVLAQAANRLRLRGHTGSIVAVAVHALCDVPAAIEGADQLVVLDGSTLNAQEADGGHERVLVAL